jgi:tryptophanyl-tRNA synthetase
MSESKVTPWDVEGKVDYDKLIEEFGTKRLSKDIKKKIKEVSEQKGIPYHIFLKRELFFSHRDFDVALDAYKKGRPFFLYTGIGPSGPMHLGHLISFRFTKYLQDIFGVNVYIQIPDDEKVWTKNLMLEDTDKYAYENMLDIAAVGFDTDKTFMFKNTEYIHNMYRMAVKTAKRISFAQAKAVFGFDNSNNIGHIFYPALQIVPTFFEKALCVIPCGIDQDNYFRLQRDFAEKIGYFKNANIHSKFLMGLEGPLGKMSASKPQTSVYLDDNAKNVKNKINKYAFSGGQATVEEHRKLGGDCDIDVSFQWLYYLFEEDDSKIERIRKEYSSGEMLSGEIKKLLIEKVNAYLEEHQKNKEEVLEKNLLDKYMYSGKLAKKMWNTKFE